MLGASWRQRARSILCPDTPRLEGQRALVTGGTEGIGLATSRGLLARGARVVMAARSAAKGEHAGSQLRGELGEQLPLDFLPLDLSDLAQVDDAASRLATQLGAERLDVLVCNAGLWPRRHSVSAQGHERAFATNVLGHFRLVRQLMGGLLANDARVVIVTGDIYVLVDDCTPDFAYRTPLGGMLAYCRSKLGDLWLAHELQRRHPELKVRAVHPGVVATSLGGPRKGLAGAVSHQLLLDADGGAQASLYCATQPDLPKGAYVHNTHGIVKLPKGDPAADAARAQHFWELCEALCESRLPA